MAPVKNQKKPLNFEEPVAAQKAKKNESKEVKMVAQDAEILDA